MQDLKSAYGTMAVGGDAAFDVMIEMRTQGYSEDEIKALIDNGGKLTPEDEIFYAVAGTGTDEDKIKETLKGKTPEQIDAIRKAYEAKHGEGSFDDDILGDLSGREDLDTKLILEMGDPSTFTEQLADGEGPGEARGAAREDGALSRRAKEVRADRPDRRFMLDSGSDQMNTAAQMEDALVAAREARRRAINGSRRTSTDPAVVECPAPHGHELRRRGRGAGAVPRADRRLRRHRRPGRRGDRRHRRHRRDVRRRRAVRGGRHVGRGGERGHRRCT